MSDMATVFSADLVGISAITSTAPRSYQLAREIRARGIRGILFVRHTWCDTWAAEAIRMKEWCKLPFLVLDTGHGDTLEERSISRVQSFLEILR